jgi:hypothetical protein
MLRTIQAAAPGRWAVAATTLLAWATVAGPARAQSDAPDSIAHRQAFVTSLTYGSDLGGLAGADAKCQARAAAAGLARAESFVAFLSSSTTDAYCHVQGFTGKRAAHCGLLAEPVAAGNWVRVDGVPFAGRIDEALSPVQRVLTPLLLDESGATVPEYSALWSGSDDYGQVHAGYPVPCADWGPAGAGEAATGASWRTSANWLISGSASCTSDARLICVESGTPTPLPPYRSGGALAFVTSSSQGGNLGGLAGADAICQGLATVAGLPAAGSFHAWLSGTGVDALDRFSYDGPWVRPDGVRIADGKSDLADGALRAPINVTETGVYLGNHASWTGTLADGGGTGSDCADWSSSDGAESAYFGLVNSPGSNWTYLTNADCSSPYHFYCLADFAAILFVDDFESSDTLAWSLTQPGL